MQTAIDVDSFTSWVSAIAAEQRAGLQDGLAADGTYEPVPGTESAFLYQRFRPEFRVAVDAWLADGALRDMSSGTTPFQTSEYQLAERTDAERLDATADEAAAVARRANQRGDNYVMMTIASALAIVLVGIGSKMKTWRAHLILTGLAALAVLASLVTLATFPIEI